MSTIEWVLRNGVEIQLEWWDKNDLANHLSIDLGMAEKIFDNYHRENHTGRYGEVEKALILDYVEQKQREQRERETRHQSELSNIEKTSVLKEQVSVLKEQLSALKEQVSVHRDQLSTFKEQLSLLKAEASSNEKEANRANRISLIAIGISALTLIATIFFEYIKLRF